MQNRYVGDVGDFGKYGLLRALCGRDGAQPLKLGVIWYLVPNEVHNEDGKHLGYLKTTKTAARDSFRRCDAPLYDELKDLLIDVDSTVRIERRRVQDIETSSILPRNTLYFGKGYELAFDRMAPLKNRTIARQAWFQKAVDKVASVDMVFVDPDNGIECASVSRTALKGPKYVFWDDILALASNGRTVVVYHHLNRSCPSAEQVGKIRTKLKSRLPKHDISAVLYKRGTRRVFFIVTASNHKEILGERLVAMLNSPWNKHFEAA